VELGARAILWTLLALVLLPVGGGWLLARRLDRWIAALIVGLAMAVAATCAYDWRIGVAGLAWGFAFGLFGAGRGVVPASLDEVADAVRSTRRWWR